MITKAPPIKQATDQAGAATQQALALSHAVAAGDLDRAQQLLSEITRQTPVSKNHQAIPPQALRPAAELRIRQRNWADAAILLSLLKDRTKTEDFKLHLAKNLHALQNHRPAVYAILSQSVETGKYELYKTPSDSMTILYHRPGEKPLVLSPTGEPVAGVTAIINQLSEPIRQGTPLGVLGIGDGYFLAEISRTKPTLFLDRQQPIHLFEPDSELVIKCLMIHDYTGPDGPIEQGRAHWHVGDQWAGLYLSALRDDPFLTQPATLIQLSRQAQDIQAQIGKVSQELLELQNDLVRRIHDLDRSRDTKELAALLGERPPRRPRALLLTSRFTTVLQYSTRDTAYGLEQLGWETQTLIEPHPWSQLSTIAVLQAVDQFKPDILFTLDHLRHEEPDLFPTNMPHVCWIQDHLPHLMRRQAGRSISKRDFVLAFAAPLFIQAHDYPQRQCIDVPIMMAVPVQRPATWTSDGDDVAYVSNVSADLNQITADLLTRVPDAFAPLLRECCRRMIATYETAGSIPTAYHLRHLFDAAASDLKFNNLDEDHRRALLSMLWNPMNIALHRQQALRWAADAADQLGLRMSLFGRGWEKHPRFAPYARGPVAPGPDLHNLVRRSKINLNLETHACISHIRMLGGLFAGGFMLVREHPENTLIQQLSNFLTQHLDPAIETAAQALRAIKPALRPRLEELIRQSVCLSHTEPPDPVRQVRSLQRAGVVVQQDQLLPHLSEITFKDPVTCKQLIQRFVADEPARRRISTLQRENIEHRLSIVTGMRRVLSRMSELISTEQNIQTTPRVAPAA